jgi:hypothetical protein
MCKEINTCSKIDCEEQVLNQTKASEVSVRLYSIRSKKAECIEIVKTCEPVRKIKPYSTELKEVYSHKSVQVN